MSVELLLTVSLAGNVDVKRAHALGRTLVAGLEHVRDGLVATRLVESGDLIVAKEPVVRIRVAARAQEKAPIRRSR